jgi:two-component system chemotaxis response regulator CheY
MRRIVINLLSQIGFTNIDEAEDGSSALEKIKGKEYKLIFSDWNMQPVSGIEFLKSTRALDAYKSTPFVMITAESTTDNIMEAKNAGVTNYIVKPFTANTLKAKLVTVLGEF